MARLREAMNVASREGLDPTDFANQIGAESGFDPRAGSPAGAQGIAQIMPATARGWGVDPMDPRASLVAAAKAMARYVGTTGSYRNALVAYNAGPGRVGKPLYPETATYIDRILGDRPGQTSLLPRRQSAQAPVSRAATGSVVGAAGPAPFSLQQRAALDMVFGDNPRMMALVGRVDAERTRRDAAPSPGPTHLVAPRAGAIGRDYRWIQQQGEKLFGLKNDPGDSQTTGGRHTAGSEHYKQRAVDFGTARNSPRQLADWARWARAQGLDVLNEGDHIHVSLPGGGT